MSALQRIMTVTGMPAALTVLGPTPVAAWKVIMEMARGALVSTCIAVWCFCCLSGVMHMGWVHTTVDFVFL